MNRFLRLLNLRRTEVPRICLAASLFFLVAINDGIVKSVSSGVFNIRVGPDRLPEMYGWIAVLFSITMVALSWLTTQVSRQRLVFGLFTALSIVLAFNTTMLWLAPGMDEGSPFAGFYSMLFVSSELVRNIAGFQVWIVAGGICFTSRAKVLFPLLAASTTLGDIGGGFLVRVLGDMLASWQTYGVAAVNTFIAIGLLRPLMRRYFVSASTGDDDAGGVSLGENLRFFAGSSYLRLLFVLSLVLFALYTAIHYGFNVVARMHYPDEGEITAFFGLFFGLAGLATLLTTTLLLRHVLRWLGVGNVYLWVCVVHVAFAACLAAVFGDVLVLPPVALMLAINLLNYVLLDSVIAPTYQVLMKVVPERNSDGTRMIMEGGFMLAGGLLGAGITLLHARDVLSLWQFFAVLFVIAISMVAVGWRLRQRYRDVLVQAVREQEVEVDDEAAMREVLAADVEVPRSLLQHNSDGVRDMGIEILRRNPEAATAICLPLTEHDNPRIRAAALKALLGSGDGVVERVALAALDDDDSEVRHSAALTLARSLAETVQATSPELRAEIIDNIAPRLSADDTDVALQAEYLTMLHRLEHAESANERKRVLAALLAAESIEERTAGINVVRHLGLETSYDTVVDNLRHVHPMVRESAVRTVGRFGRRDGCVALMEALADPDPDVVKEAITGLQAAAPHHGLFLVEGLSDAPTKQWEGLIRSLANADEDGVAPILLEDCRARLLEANRYLVIRQMLAALDDDSGAAALLIDQLDLEERTRRDAAISLLGQLGDVDVVAGLVERMNDDVPGARDNAIELLENIGNRALLEPLLPLLTDDDEERLSNARHLSGWNNGNAPTIEQALACVVRSPDPWTQLAGVWAARALGYDNALNELRDDAPDFVKEILGMETDTDGASGGQPLTSMEKITFLKGSPFFEALPLEELYHIAQSVQEETVPEGTTVIEQDSLGDKMYIVVTGKLEVRRFDDGDETGVAVAEMGDKQVFGDMALLDDEPRSASVIALSECRLLSLQRDDLSRILRRYSSIALSMMRILSRRLRRSMAA